MKRVHVAIVALAVVPLGASLASGCSSSSSGGGSGSQTQGSCQDAWNKAVAACPSASANEQAFLQECNNPSQFGACASQATALDTCIRSASSYTCDSAGQPHAVGCDSQSAAFGMCILGSLGDAGFTD